MNTERTVVLENVSDSDIGLSDTQGRMYRLGANGRVRISAVSLQDIFDCPGSKIIFKEGMAKVENISREELYAMGLTEEEIDLFLIEKEQPQIVITEKIEEEKEEIIIPVEEKIEEPVAKKATKTATKKPAKKSTKTK